MASDKQKYFLERLLTVDLGLDGERILNESIKLNQVLNKLPYKLEYLGKQNRTMANMVGRDLKRFVGVIKRYQDAAGIKKAKPLGFFKRISLNNFRIKFERSLAKLK